ncbi:MAG: R3H domain-containing nucleic acid-binding protein [Patescibacteria group bacterium]
MQKNEIHNLIKEFITKTNLCFGEIVVSDNADSNDGNNNLDLSKKQKPTWFSLEITPYILNNREDEAIFALNHLARRITENVSRGTTEYTGKTYGTPQVLPVYSYTHDFIIDINNFQKQHIEKLHSIAHTMAERARFFKSSIEIDPMSAFDRRIIHEFLSDASDLKTESIGEGFSRRVVIKYSQ